MATMLSQNDVLGAARKLAEKISEAVFSTGHQKLRLWGIPKGGVPVCYLLSLCLPSVLVETAEEADVIVDDLVETGATLKSYQQRFPEKTFAVLFNKTNDSDALSFLYGEKKNPRDWICFPWERSGTGTDHSMLDIATRLLEFIGEDPARPGLKETPQRFAKSWEFFTSGYRQDPAEILKTFEDGAEGYNGMVVVNKIPVFSMCEHHLLVFFGQARIAYIPNGRVLGLSKFARLVEVFARRLQVQERLTVQIADALQEHLQPKGVGVILECRHLCMETRGVRTPGSITATSALRGCFNEDKVRHEFLSLNISSV